MAKPRKLLNSTEPGLSLKVAPPSSIFVKIMPTPTHLRRRCPWNHVTPSSGAFYLRSGNNQSEQATNWPNPRNNPNPLPIEMRKDGHIDRRVGPEKKSHYLQRKWKRCKSCQGSPLLAGVRESLRARFACPPSPLLPIFIFSLQENLNKHLCGARWRGQCTSNHTQKVWNAPKSWRTWGS